MPDFSKRSAFKEILDDPAVPFEDIKKNMQELDFINTWLGGHAITLLGFKKIYRGKKNISICEIGCGGGDNLRILKNYCSKHQITATLTGIDINENCTAFAASRKENEGIHFITSDYALVKFDTPPDIIFSSLFCHHFTKAELQTMIPWMANNCNLGFFINDLHRHPLAYHSIRLLSSLFSKSYMVKHDAPLSVLRGFSKKEWSSILSPYLATTTIQWQWAFRWLIVFKK
jgi:2-polyprenyl-3-methyl-5-hydroxy-6-metoxy-1,4-benzoquinol methylase